MFFDISYEEDERFPHSIILDRFVINTDPGWKQIRYRDKTMVYKGYADHGRLEDMLPQIAAQTAPGISGNFCVIEHDPGCATLTIKTDRCRAFPLYYEQGQCITNLRPGPNTVWSDSVLTIESDLTCQQQKFDVIGSTQAMTCTVDDIHRYLYSKIKSFLVQDRPPIRMFLTGGVDTTLLYSYLKVLDAPHEVVWHSHLDHDYFYLRNHGDLQQYWSYQQIHHWNDPCMLVSGTPGDAFTMRSPVTAALWLLEQGTDMPTQIDIHAGCRHEAHFRKPKHQDLFERQIQSWQPSKNLVWDLCNINANDWQHWHLGNTLTWTPLRDLELFKMFLNLDQEQILGQIFDSTISIELIEKNVPGLSDVISDQKNTGNYLQNLTKLFFKNKIGA